MLHTLLTAAWDLRLPVISAPMAGSAYGRLARAVTAAGGLGMIGVGYGADVATIAAESAVARGDDDARFGIGLMVWALERRPELLDAAIAERPFAISLSFGDPTPLVPRLHDAGIRVATQVNSGAHAARALDAGVDLIVAQGTESGGHTGQVATLPLLQVVLDVMERRGALGKVLVLAAGGVASARGMAAVLAAGADGAWIGTALLASPEATVNDAARDRILRARETDTALTRAFDVAQGLPWPKEHPGRALVNAFTERWTGHEDELPRHPDAVALYQQGVRQNDYGRAHLYAGQSVGLVERARPVGEILSDVCGGAELILRSRVPNLIGT